MKEILLAVVFVLFTSSILFAQGYNDHRSSVNLVRGRINRIMERTTEAEVVKLLGEADRIEVYQNARGRIVKVLYYLVDDATYCITEKMDECYIPLLFEMGQLLSKGWESLDIAIKRYDLERGF